jgi:hydrogenase/urease accessory protein HupE
VKARVGSLALWSFVLLPSAAEAHLNSTGMGPIYDGVMHFLTSPEDLLSVLALALWAGLRGASHGRGALLVIPSAWLASALAGSALPAESAPAVVSSLGLMLLGVLLAFDAKLGLRAWAALAACVGLYHGWLNGTGLGWSLSAAAALAGVVSAVFALVALAAALVIRLRADWARIAARVAGSWIAATGLLWLGWAARSTG